MWEVPIWEHLILKLMSPNFEEVEGVRGDESTATNADAEDVERASKRQRQAENALAQSAADDAEQDSPAPTPDEVGFVPGSLRFDGANVESYRFPNAGWNQEAWYLSIWDVCECGQQRLRSAQLCH